MVLPISTKQQLEIWESSIGIWFKAEQVISFGACYSNGFSTSFLAKTRVLKVIRIA